MVSGCLTDGWSATRELTLTQNRLISFLMKQRSDRNGVEPVTMECWHSRVSQNGVKDMCLGYRTQMCSLLKMAALRLHYL